MRAWGLSLLMMIACVACATPPPSAGPPSPMDRYGGPPLPDPVNYDRAEVIPGFFAPGRQPDGNTVILASADGLIVFDTGRHPAHADRILAAAKARSQPIAAIVNSHWHLDHVSGNIPLRAAFPSAVVYANDAAMAGALDGFLARGLESNRRMVADPATPPALAEDLRGDIATVEQGDRLRAAVSIAGNRTVEIGGRSLLLRSARAASEGDVWLYDRRENLIAAGDLVTLPAPFLDTACPELWREALDDMLQSPFERLIPGHGREMTRADVVLYRDAFNALLDCAAGDATAAACADGWAASAAPLLDGASGTQADAAAYAKYYVEAVLRAGKTRADCPA